MLFSRGVLPQNRFSRGILTETLEIPGQGVFYEAGNSRSSTPQWGLKLQSAIRTPKHKNLSYIFLQILSGYHHYPKHKNKSSSSGHIWKIYLQ